MSVQEHKGMRPDAFPVRGGSAGSSTISSPKASSIALQNRGTSNRSDMYRASVRSETIGTIEECHGLRPPVSMQSDLTQAQRMSMSKQDWARCGTGAWCNFRRYGAHGGPANMNCGRWRQLPE
uniref:Uncharacterized protein n=1 Tax=Alexandrium andersonii TaxID=327968 RepID=A0A7S2F5Q4_9DINO